MQIVIASFTLSLALIGAASVTRAQESPLAPALEASAPVVPSAGAQLAETPAGLDTSPAGTCDALGATAGAGPIALAAGVAMGSLSLSSPAGRPDASTAGEGTVGGGTQWGPLLKQSFALLAAQHVYRATFASNWDRCCRRPRSATWA